MAYPFIFDETFDDGTRGGFDSEVGSGLDFAAYTVLARFGLAPWRGAHVLRHALNGADTGHVFKNGSFGLTAGGTTHVWLPVCIGADVILNDGDTVILLAFSSNATNEVVFGVRRSGANYQLFAGETGATHTLTITRSNTQYYQVELSITLDAGGANDGTIDFYVDGGQVGTQITGLNQGVIDLLSLGVISGTAAGDSGNILIGGIVVDDTRIYPRTRFPQDTVWVTRDINAFVGPCCIDNVTLTGTGTNAVLTILDTDIFSSTGIAFSREPVSYVRNVTANDQSPGLNTPIELKRGAYVQLTGTNPQAWVSMKSDYGQGSVVKSHANYVDRGLRRNSLL